MSRSPAARPSRKPHSVYTLAADLTYEEVLSGETHHAAFFRLQIEDTVVNGMDYALLDADGNLAEVTIFWRPLPSAVEMQGHLALDRDLDAPRDGDRESAA
jgi:hypothetical protein